MAFWRAKDAKSVEMLPGVSRSLISYGDRVMAIRFDLANGGKVPDHTHPHEQIGFVISGQLMMTIGGESLLLGPGDGYAIPSNVNHCATAEEDSIVADIFSPIRDDYLP